jgi:putative ABC transport system permease protein
MLGRLFRSLRSLVRRDSMEHEMDRELRFHLEREIEENVRRGMTPEEARYGAMRSFGGVEQVKEECRDTRGTRFVEALGQDVRFGARTLRKNPGFTALAVLTLALGIGANTAIFSVVNGVLLRPLPYENGDRLVVLQQQAPLAGAENMNFSPKDFDDFREQTRTLDGMAEYHSMSFILLGREEPEQVQTGVVSANFFDLLGVKPILGRTFLPDEDKTGAEPVLVLSNRYWQQSHGSDPDIVGKTFVMNDRVHAVVGVLPPVPSYPGDDDVYMPTCACPFRSSERTIENRRARMVRALGLLKPDETADHCRADMATIAGRLKETYPDAYPASAGYTAGATALGEALTERARPTLLILLGTAGLVLLIACANVANLFLARMVRRERELAVRAALGAGRTRLLRQLLTESTLLALAGGALGLLIAYVGLDLLSAFAARFTPRTNDIAIDGSVLLFTLVVSIATGLAFGSMPALPSGENLVTALKEGGSSASTASKRQRVRSVLIVAQVAISFVLLIGAGLMIRSLIRLQQVDPGFNPENVLTMSVALNWSKYTSAEQRRAFFESLLERVDAHPGVLSAALTGAAVPLAQSRPFNNGFQIKGRPVEDGTLPPQADTRIVSPKYFQSVGIPLVKGRTFTEGDRQDAPEVAVINQSLARRYWGNDDPVGARVTFDRGESWVAIVGVVGDAKQRGLDREPTDELYAPFAQNPLLGASLLVRTASDPMSMAHQMRDAVYEVDPQQPVTDVQTLEQVRAESLASPRLTAALLGLFAALALIITATGISGVMALWVSQRTHEIGIRMALGATQGKVLRMVLGQGMTLVLAGLAAGAAGALALNHVLSGMLFGVAPTDPLTYVAVALVLVTAAAMACFAPARRATAIDPMVALRTD